MANQGSGGKVKATEDKHALVLSDLAWAPLDTETTAGQNGLTPLLLHRLGHRTGSHERTVAQVLVDRMLERTLDGHHPSLEEILMRIDGDAKSTGPAVRSTRVSLVLDEITTQRLLDAVLEPGDCPPGD